VAHRIVMPSFGMYTAEGTLGRWLREPGAGVAAGEPIVEIVTDKATYEVEAPAGGVLHPLAASGDAVVVERLIGWILDPGEAPPASEAPAAAGPLPGTDVAATPGTAGEPWRGGAGAARADAAAGRGAAAADATSAAATAAAATRIVATPAARRLARERGVDLAAVAASGPGGRIVEADVLDAAAQGGAAARVAEAALAAAAASVQPLPWRVRERIPLTGLRRTIAARLLHSRAISVPLTLTREVRADALVAARRELLPRLAADLPYDALFVKILAEAVRERPELNATVAGDAILVLDEVHVAFAVSLPAGLVAPVVHHPDRRSLAEVAGEVRELVARARAGALLGEQVSDATITLSNLGAHGIDAFTPVLAPPQAAILGVGRLAPRPVVVDGERGPELAVAATCVLSLTFDHRVTDGVPAAALLDAVARRMTDAAWLGALA
jgi:pyruvate/2-oxoglutarate dehydrogenase complex dihydrolipoamide acyltransferase (E2) component